MSDVYPDSYDIRRYVPAYDDWETISADVISDISVMWGLAGNKPGDRLAEVGHMEFTLKNSGAYIPGLGAAIPTWQKGLPIRIYFYYKGYAVIRFHGRIDKLSIDVGVSADATRVSVTVLDWMEYAAKHPLLSPGYGVDKRADEALTTLLATMPIQPAHTNFGQGENVFPAVFDSVTTETKAYSEMAKLAYSEMGYIYLRKNEWGDTLVFENAHERSGLRVLTIAPDLVSVTYLLTDDGGYLLKEDGGKLILSAGLALTVDNTMMDMDVSYGTNIINRMKIAAYPKRVDTSAQVLYTLETRVEIPPGDTVTFRGAYTDPAGGATNVNADPATMIAPVAVTDYSMFTERDGTGSDITANAAVTASYGVEGVEYQVTNNSAFTGYFQVQARGKGIYQYRTIEGSEESAASYGAYGYQEVTIEQRYQRDIAAGMAEARKIIELEKNPRTVLERVWMNANSSHDAMLMFLTGDVGDLVRIVNNQLEIDSWYWIQQVEYVVKNGGLGFVNYGWKLKEHFSLLNRKLELVSVELSDNGIDKIDYGYLPQVANLTQKTICVWLTRNSSLPVHYQHVVSTYSWPNGRAGFTVGINNLGGQIQYIDGGQDSVTYGQWQTGYISDLLIFVVITRDNTIVSNPPRIYVNGVEQVVTQAHAQTGVSNESGLALRLGDSLNGKLEDARIYDRILSTADIQAIYAEGPGGNSITDGMVFQGPCVRRENADPGGILTSEKPVLDNVFGMVGTAVGGEITQDTLFYPPVVPVVGPDIVAGTVSTAVGTLVSSISWSHTVAAGSNRLLVVKVMMRGFAQVNSVTWGGVNLVRRGYALVSSGNNPRAEIWYMTAPATGTNTVVVTLSGIDFWQAAAEDYANVDQAYPLGPMLTAYGDNVTGISATTESASDDVVIDVLTMSDAGVTATPAQTPLFNIDVGPNAPWRGLGSLGTGSANRVMSWSFSGLARVAQAVVTIQKA
jgi:hypothetical protein